MFLVAAHSDIWQELLENRKRSIRKPTPELFNDSDLPLQSNPELINLCLKRAVLGNLMANPNKENIHEQEHKTINENR